MNQDLSFDDKNFISVGRASEITGYTQDYIGQLSRASKIPARIVGRTWYVDQEALLTHKINRKLRSKKNDISIVKSSIPENNSYKSPFVFQNDDQPLLPSLSRPEPVVTVRPNRAFHHALTLASVAALIIAGSFSWLTYMAPRSAEIFAERLESTSRGLALGLYRAFNKDFQVVGRLSLGAASQAIVAPVSPIIPKASGATSEAIAQNGVVVFPDTPTHDKAVAAVQNAFSDDAKVSFDDSGTSGVITPVFRKKDTSENYAFVLVPIKKTQ